MSKVLYPAVFHVCEDDAGYSIEFPDLPDCFTIGKNDADALEKAKDALSLWLDRNSERSDITIPAPSSLKDISNRFPGEIVMLIEGDPDYYYRKYHNKAVKKTLSIPQWLNDKASKANVNFSQVLQEALIDKLGL